MKNKTFAIFATALYLFFVGFWVYIATQGLQGDHYIAEVFSGLYGLMALSGGIFGLIVGKKFGGFKSYIGATVMFISLGLLAQEAGQLTYSAYTQLFKVEVPYPSWGDVGYFGSVILYILAAWNAAKAVQTKIALKSKLNRTLITVLPLLLLGASYYIFLSDYQADSSDAIASILDFAYPIGQALYIAIALLAFLLSRQFLGGIMKGAVMLLIGAFALQYAADFVFLYQHNQDTWKTAGFNELMYLTAYFVTTLSLIKFNGVILQLSSGGDEDHDSSS